MTNKDDVSHPYDWIDPVDEYWAIHGNAKVGHINWAKAPFEKWEQELSELYPERAPKEDPWSNGRYALAALVWGLILLVVFGVGAGP